MALDSGGIFAVFWLILFVPISVISAVWFFSRREVQPIKARQPVLVIVSDVILIIWTIVLGAQRLVKDQYPCVLVMWQAYLGTILLCNVYLVRAYLLFMNFNYTDRMLKIAELLSNKQLVPMIDDVPQPGVPYEQGRFQSVETPDGVVAGHPRIPAILGANRPVRLRSVHGGLAAGRQESDRAAALWEVNRSVVSRSFLFKWMGLVSFLLLVPPIVVSLDNAELRAAEADSCLNKWGYAAWILGVYSLTYVGIFIALAAKLRSKFDNFGIKNELRATGSVALIVIIPWLVINMNADMEKDVNKDFPVSTALLFFAVTWAFFHSTILPLYKSIIGIGTEISDVPEDLSTFTGLLSSERGFQDFKRFLTSEFSVENILFWKDAIEFKHKGEHLMRRERELMVASVSQTEVGQQLIQEYFDLVKEAQTLFTSYVMPEAPLAINVASSVRSILYDQLLQIQENPDFQFRENEGLRSLTYLFNDAEQHVYALMERDSYTRYKSSEYYRKLVESVARDVQAKDMFRKVGVM